jgi:purine-binding chemotaxis protein CheW
VQHNEPHLIARVAEISVAVPCSHVREVVTMPALVVMPNQPVFAGGAANLRGSLVKVLNLRALWDMPTQQKMVEDTVAMLGAREEDHKRWLKELEASVLEKREFKLARDPHLCAFGKWYYAYKSDNHTLAALLRRFETPHARIHAIADGVRKLADGGDFAGALQIIERARDNELKEMLDLFEQLRQSFRDSNRELLLVLTDGRGHVGLSIDSVDAVENVSDEIVSALPMSGVSHEPQRYVEQVVKRVKTKDIVMLLDAAGLIKDFPN